MKVSEKSISIWTVIELHRDLFYNPAYSKTEPAQRVTSIGSYDSWNVRFWKEYFCQFREADGEPDADKQLDLAIEEEVDQQILLQSLLQRTSKQLEIGFQQVIHMQQKMMAQKSVMKESKEIVV